SLWNNPQRQVSEGDLTVDNFNATLTADATVGTMRYINQNDGTLTIPAGLNLEVAHGGILIGTNVFNNDKKILGAGTLNGGLANSEGSRDILIHNYNPAASFEIGVKITSASVEIASTDKETGGGDAGGTIAAGSSILEIGNDSYVNLFTNIEVGMLVTGPGIPDGTVVVSFDGGANQNVTLSAPASANVSMGDFSFVTLTNFVNAGTGTTTLSGSNTYSGSTIISGGSLLLANANAIPGGIGATGGTSALIVKGGVVGLGAGDFTRDIGSDEESILFTGSGGFAAYGSDRTVNLGGAGATVGFGRGDFVPSASDLILGWGDSTHKVTFVNPLDLGAVSEMVRVENGFAEVDGELAGGLQGRGRLVKGGLGTLRLSATSTSTGGVELAEGELRLANVADVAGTGVIQLGTSPTNTLAEAQMTLTLEGGTIANDWKAGGGNDDGNNLIQALADVTLSGAGTLEQQVLLGSEPGVTMSLIGDIAGTSAGGFTVINEGVVELSGNNSYGGGSVAGTAIDGDTIVRSGTLELGSDTAAGTGVIELGDALPAVLTADVATTGRNMTLNGGYFDEEHNGLAAQAGGPGAFVQVSEDVNGVDYSALANGTRVLIKDQGENPEQNGIYEIVRLPDQPAGTMNLVRVSDFDETSELAYGTRVDVTGGASYFVADSVAGANTSAVNFREDVVNPDVALLINETGVMVANDIDINATNGTGTTSLGGAPSLTTGTAEFSGDVVLQDVIGGVQEAKTVILTSATPTDEGVTFSGSFSEADTGGGATDDILSIIKQGAGTVTLTGESTYTGPTTVSAGTLLVNNSNVISGSATGSGLVTVESGATLGGIGRIGGSVAVVGTAGNLATLSPGTPSTTDGIGTLTVGGNLELGEYSQTLFTLGGNGFNDQVVTGTLTVDPSAIFKVLFDLTYEPNVMIGDTFNLFDWTGLVSGDSNMVDNLELPTLSGGLVWNTSQFNSTGVISITGVPEPARWALLLTGLLAICLRRRR
ncbi:MAG: autotransporter-associated beta strand repeat-containing protein, partial [Verrucomicrobiales bacterium]|nr:autotransporter-associated beta strand repeat-containing protein [Verrucomicrobiales bacterium]